jgi:shikimate kinase
MQQNIILIGMMGSGKTTIGKAIAQRINYPFFDSDHVIEEKCGTSISTIFSLEGELGFRKRESEVIQFLCTYTNIVIATGGGAILNPDNRNIFKSKY